MPEEIVTKFEQETGHKISELKLTERACGWDFRPLNGQVQKRSYFYEVFSLSADGQEDEEFIPFEELLETFKQEMPDKPLSAGEFLGREFNAQVYFDPEKNKVVKNILVDSFYENASNVIQFPGGTLLFMAGSGLDKGRQDDAPTMDGQK